MTIHDEIFAIDKGIAYQYNLPFITTVSSGCVSLKAKVQVIQCQSLVGMSWSGGQNQVKYTIVIGLISLYFPNVPFTIICLPIGNLR